MRTRFFHLFSIIWFWPTAVFAADYQQGLDAVHQQDYLTAYQVFKDLAAEGDVNAQYNLAILLREGQGVMQNPQEAAKWFQKAADQGLPEAQYDLGALYEYGVGVKQSYEEAAVWYLKSAQQGDPLAQTNLAVLYANGQGVRQDIVLAYVWSNLAASQGVTEALKNRELIAETMTPDMLNRVKEISRDYFQRYVAPYQSEKSKRPGGRRRPPPAVVTD